MAPAKQSIRIYGLIKEAEFYQAKVTAEGLYRVSKELFEEPKCTGMISYQWLHFLEEKKQEIGGQLWSYSDNTMVFVDDSLIGSAKSFLEWVDKEHDYRDLSDLKDFIGH